MHSHCLSTPSSTNGYQQIVGEFLVTKPWENHHWSDALFRGVAICSVLTLQATETGRSYLHVHETKVQMVKLRFHTAVKSSGISCPPDG